MTAGRLLMVEQRVEPGVRGGDGAPWILEGARRVAGRDDDRRVREIQAGLARHPGVRAAAAHASDEELAETLGRLHEPDYLEALAGISSDEPVLAPLLTAPGLAPDTPVHAGIVTAAREGARTAISAARRVLGGARLAYAVCRPPGHHAGPGWLGGYCYLNNAAAAAATLRAGGAASVGVLDLDLHYPNGTAAILAERLAGVPLHSLHAWPVTNAPEPHVEPRTDTERLVEFRGAPAAAAYLDALAGSLRELASSCSVLVLSLGYDTIRGDPHGSWRFQPAIFAEIGSLLAQTGLALCVVQEGGYALGALAQCSHAFACGLLDGARSPSAVAPLEGAPA